MLRRYLRREHRLPEQRGSRNRLLRRYSPDLRQARPRFRLLVLLVPGRQLLRCCTDCGCSAGQLQRRAAGGDSCRIRISQPLLATAIRQVNEKLLEWYGKATYTFNDQWAAGVQEWYSPSVSNTGAMAGTRSATSPTPPRARGSPTASACMSRVTLGYWASRHQRRILRRIAGCCLPKRCRWSWTAGDEVHELLELGRWPWLHLQGFYARSALLRHQSEQVSVQRLHQRANSSFSTSNVTAQKPDGLGSNWCTAAFVAKLSLRDQPQQHPLTWLSISRSRPVAETPPAVSFGCVKDVRFPPVPAQAGLLLKRGTGFPLTRE